MTLMFLLAASLAISGGVGPGHAATTRADDIRIDSALVIRPAMRGGRSPVFADPVEHLLVRGQWARPAADDRIGEGELSAWQAIEADARGLLSHPALAGGYAWTVVESDIERVALLDARGHRHVYINGEPRAGDLYDAGTLRIPFLLRAGENELLFRGARGRLRATITEPPAPIFIETRDQTLPDIIIGEVDELLAGIIISNATAEYASGLRMIAVVEGVERETQLPDIVPLTVRKVPVRIQAPIQHAAGEVPAQLQLWRGTEHLHTATIAIQVRQPSMMHRRTFISEIDGSVQYFAVQPRAAAPSQEEVDASPDAPGLILTLHGASVEAVSQAAAYAPKDWAHIVAPTNRRPYGFDWEDWGRIDAMEVLNVASQLLGTDARRTYLTGHSMGGHGTWQLAVHYPGVFAAAAPSAGWPDFWSYSGAPQWSEGTPVEQLLHRAANASRTRSLARNLQHSGIYILHGDADDNVPVAQARMMREILGGFHTNFTYFEQPGAGHWWGNQCVDWPPLMDFLKRHERPADHQIQRIDFLTANPAISSRCYWATIEQQQRPLEFSRLQASINIQERRITASTENIALLSFDLGPFVAAPAMPLSGDEPITIVIDGQTLDLPLSAAPSARTPAPLRLARAPGDGGVWFPGGGLNSAHKHPGRSGPFKEAFNRRFILVYGTGGTPEENEWSLARARFDAETFLYRGNGAPDIVSDATFARSGAGASAATSRNIILYGNADTNRAWSILLPESPIDVRRSGITVGERTLQGDDLACLFVYPRASDTQSLIGVVSGTGLPGMRLTNQLPYFVSGVAYPDWIIISADMLQTHTAGIRAAGYLRNDWSLGEDAAWHTGN